MSSCEEIRPKMKKILNSHKFHTTVLVLVVIDCFVVTAELVIDHLNDILQDSSKKKAMKSAPTASNSTHPEHHEHHHHHDEHLDSGFGKWGPFFHVLEEIFKYTSLVILSIFIVEIILKIIFTPRNFAKIIEIFDVFVVIISFGLNLYLFNKKHHIHSITGLITMLRLWRFTEIINAVVLTIETKHEGKIEELKERVKELEAENNKLRQQQGQSNYSEYENYDEYDKLNPGRNDGVDV